MKVLVVGAGFSGAVYARTLAENGLKVHVIDQRSHIAGNAFDAIVNGNIRVHQYGPHLFHTNNKAVVDWIKRFGKFVDYEHRVNAKFGDQFLPLPISRATFESFYNRTFESQADLEGFIEGIADPCDAPRNAAEFLNAKVGKDITDLIFRPYTKKMWGEDLEDMDASVVARISINMDREYRYFPKDSYQFLPVEGYTKVFESIFDHDNISIRLNASYDLAMSEEYQQTFTAAAIDEHFGYRFGALPYRSLRFHHRQLEDFANPPSATVNYTDAGPYTRETYWHLLPHHRISRAGRMIKTVEEPCDFMDNGMERYYPIKDSRGENHALYTKYKALADSNPSIKFIGRCGTYQYLDMHQVINQSIIGSGNWLREQGR